ncbi:hypothetical protein B0T25DRAFT_542092 [Lasiosphaeria hispida]|uniref:Uncharacterized protein n=1 Tax=Lasiosphaeria hispida TaxID=260671 RepID=A0AAJ0HH14_9PEZI|nr:hypothetical protein B0T25DRAFT_542092 [Lasiosphaeria hispida]
MGMVPYNDYDSARLTELESAETMELKHQHKMEEMQEANEARRERLEMELEDAKDARRHELDLWRLREEETAVLQRAKIHRIVAEGNQRIREDESRATLRTNFLGEEAVMHGTSEESMLVREKMLDGHRIWCGLHVVGVGMWSLHLLVLVVWTAKTIML